jgi:transcriptional regulator with XRE-family HTH domain
MTTTNALTLGSLRRAFGLTQEELARRVGTHRVTVARWESGTNTPSLRQMEQIARALNVPLQLIVEALKVSA